jgi:hypothetical protein
MRFVCGFLLVPPLGSTDELGSTRQNVCSGPGNEPSLTSAA